MGSLKFGEVGQKATEPGSDLLLQGSSPIEHAIFLRYHISIKSHVVTPNGTPSLAGANYACSLYKFLLAVR